jgi:polysaccharide deacetylase family protein (PEP-CTERM system associated)
VSQWEALPSWVEESTARVLEMLEGRGVKATFFVLGWLAERKPTLVRRIAEAGHEIGCHSHMHRLVYEMTRQEFRQDTRRAQRAIEDACGVSPCAYRAPSYSIVKRSWWALEELVDCGFTHDSSVYPVKHDRYGVPGFGRHAQLVMTGSGPITEVPAATVQLGDGKVTPVGGGAYLRLLPYRYTAAGLRRINEVERQPACVYMHPWELDAGQPRLAQGVIARLRTYCGLRGMAAKLERLLAEFRFTTLGEVHP